MLERLKEKYGINQPIFIKEILDEMKEYSRARVFQLLKKYEGEKQIIKFDTGVYYIPRITRFGLSNISVEQVVKKKYISNNEEVYGIYGGLTLQLNFLLSYQVPVTLEVITNNETMWNRDVMINGRKIIVKKSRTTINKENV